ncbi:MAG: MaoC/PaaZ C-terminal domain-containing protein [Pseudomonadota bacterium]
MTIDRDKLLATTVEDEPCSYTESDSILYALGVGFATDPNDSRALAYVYDGTPMRTVPTMANRMLSSTFLRTCGWNARRLAHVEEHLDLYRPLPPAAELLANRRVRSVEDLGAAVGARIVIEAELRLARDATVLFNCSRTIIARADGGFGSGEPAAGMPHHALPSREADLACDIETTANQALLFRLVDSRHPVHVDRRVAEAAGFDGPVLHGRCTLGIACHAILKTICEYDFTLISSFTARFTQPVFPGDTIRVEMWQDRDVVSFRALVPERQVVVLDNGRCSLAT